jgi:putative endonuclease
MGKHNELGKKGEDIAADFLTRRNMIILDRNWRFGRTELDIVVMDGKTMVFVEVKTRSDDIHERPEDAVNPRKRQRITRTAIAYMDAKGMTGLSDSILWL